MEIAGLHRSTQKDIRQNDLMPDVRKEGRSKDNIVQHKKTSGKIM